MGYWKMTFDEWYNDVEREEWHKDNYDEWKTEWMVLQNAGVHTEIIARVFNNVVKIMKEEYGD